MIFNKWKQDFLAGKKQSVLKTFVESEDVEFGLVATLKFKNEGEDLQVDGGLEETEDGNIIYVDFKVDRNVLPEMWSEISMNLKDVMRHEIEHITQNVNSHSHIQKHTHRNTNEYCNTTQNQNRVAATQRCNTTQNQNRVAATQLFNTTHNQNSVAATQLRIRTAWLQHNSESEPRGCNTTPQHNSESEPRGCNTTPQHNSESEFTQKHTHTTNARTISPASSSAFRTNPRQCSCTTSTPTWVLSNGSIDATAVCAQDMTARMVCGSDG
jgi:hypothetical protein